MIEHNNMDGDDESYLRGSHLTRYFPDLNQQYNPNATRFELPDHTPGRRAIPTSESIMREIQEVDVKRLPRKTKVDLGQDMYSHMYPEMPKTISGEPPSGDLIMLPKSYLSKIQTLTPPCMHNSEMPMVCQCPYLTCPVTDTKEQIDEYLKNKQPVVKNEKGVVDIEDLKPRKDSLDLVESGGVNKKSKSAPTWKKMDLDLFNKMVQYEKDHPNIKQADLQRLFNVNRSTYWRWKKKYNLV